MKLLKLRANPKKPLTADDRLKQELRRRQQDLMGRLDLLMSEADVIQRVGGHNAASRHGD